MKKYDCKVNLKNRSMNPFKRDYHDQTMKVYGTVLFSVAFKKKMKVVVVQYINDGKIGVSKI